MESLNWPEYPTLTPDGVWIGGCSFPRRDGPCGRRTMPGTDGCRKHLLWARWYQRTIGPFMEIALRITRKCR